MSVTESSATALVADIKAGRVSAVDAVEACIARIEAVDPLVNAMPQRRFAEARAEARRADAKRAAGEQLGALHGLPISIKDQLRLEGMPTTLGLERCRGFVEPSDGPMVRRLREAGAIVLGKGNVMQLLLGWECENPVFGRTNNPWNLDRTPGGSSGGDAAVVAYGGVPLALGGDFGGSLRLPAAFCGVCSLKPTGGRLTPIDTPSEGYAHQEAIIPQPGPIARRVADLILAMEVLAAPGQAAFDPSVPPVPWLPIESEALRVGISDDNGVMPVSPAIKRAVREAGEALRSSGTLVKDVPPLDGEEALRCFIALTSADGFARSAAYVKGEKLFAPLQANLKLAGIPPMMARLVATGMSIGGRSRIARLLRLPRATRTADYFDVLARRAALRAAVLAEWDRAGIDVLICPAVATPAFLHGASGDLLDAVSYAFTWNVLGFPAGVVPVTLVRDDEEAGRGGSASDAGDRAATEGDRGSAGLPACVQVVGRPWEEHRVLAAMHAVEAAVGFAAVPVIGAPTKVP